MEFYTREMEFFCRLHVRGVEIFNQIFTWNTVDQFIWTQNSSEWAPAWWTVTANFSSRWICEPLGGWFWKEDRFLFHRHCIWLNCTHKVGARDWITRFTAAFTKLSRLRQSYGAVESLHVPNQMCNITIRLFVVSASCALCKIVVGKRINSPTLQPIICTPKENQ